MLREKIFIDGLKPPEVWPFLADPQWMQQWNAKLSGVSRGRQGVLLRGERFEMRYTIGGRQRSMTATVEECMPERRLAITHRQADWPPGRCVRESYELLGQDEGTLIRHALDVRQSGLPLWARLLIRVIGWLGTPTETGPLEKLKAMLEEEKPPR